MKIFRLKPLFIFFSIATALVARAQLKLPVTDNDFKNNLSKVISGYSNQFLSLKGDTLSSGPQTIEFSSRLDFKQAKENFITEYKSQKPIYSWQAVILNTEDFEEASKKYKWLCNQLTVMKVKLLDGSYSLTGTYNAPDESKQFSAGIFKLTPTISHLAKLKIEARMEFEFPEWKVNLLVYEKEREDNEQGNANDD